METKNCLIVDDEQIILSMISDCLGALGYSCVTATSAEAALTLLVHSSFDIMITDIQMAGMTGIELTRDAKQLYPTMPVIVMTGFTDEYSYDEVIEAGADDFLKKPFSIKELDTRVARVIRDVNLMSLIKQKSKELEEVSTLMIAGLQEEALEKIATLEQEIRHLKEESELKKP